MNWLQELEEIIDTLWYESWQIIRPSLKIFITVSIPVALMMWISFLATS